MQIEFLIGLAAIAIAFLVFVGSSPKRQSANVRMVEGLGQMFLVQGFDGNRLDWVRTFVGWLPDNGMVIVNGLGKVAQTEDAILLQNPTLGFGGNSSYSIPQSQIIYEGKKFIASALMTFDVISIRGVNGGKLLVKAGKLRFQ